MGKKDKEERSRTESTHMAPYKSIAQTRADEQATREQGRVNNFVRNLTKQAANGDGRAALILEKVQSGELDLSAAGKSGITSDADRRKNLETRKTLTNRKVEALYGNQGEIPEPGQAPNAPRPTNAGTTADRAELAPPAPPTPPLAPSARTPSATSPARQGDSGNAAPVKRNFAKEAQDLFKSDLEKSELIRLGRSGEVSDLPGQEADKVKAAQEMALKRGESLGGNREQLQAMIGMETDSEAKTRKDQEYQDKYGDSDQKYKELLGRNLTENGKPLTGEKATAAINKMFDAMTPQDRLDSISKLEKGPSEKTKALLLEAKQKAAASTGYTGEVTADTDFGAELKAAIPGGKNAMQSLIDAGDLVPGSESNPSLQKSIQELKERRGAAMFSQTQMDIVNQAPSVTSEKGESVDPLSTGNPLFDNPNADSVAWANSNNTSKNNTSDKPIKKSSGTPTKELSASFQDQPFTSPDFIKPWFMGDTGKSNKPTEKAWYDKKASEVFQAPDFLNGTMIGGVIDSIGEFSKPDIKKMAEKGQPSRLEKLQYEGSEIDDIGEIIKKGKTATPEERKQVNDANRKTLEERRLPEEISKAVQKFFSTGQKVQDQDNWFNARYV